MLKHLITVLYLLFTLQLLSQEKKAVKYDLIPPVDFEILLSGTFGELRSDHFHSGIDIKTQGLTGKPVRAVADGYVSRIKISPSGFGRTLYISHPNGLMSVYAHLQEFRKDIENFTIKTQYKRESFSVNIFPDKEQLIVKKGEIIALSGNSGYSMGPHLHFEIRNDNTQVPQNPLLYSFEVKDDIKPILNALKIYNIGKNSLINGLKSPYEINLKKKKKDVHIKDTVYVYSQFAIGVSSIDKQNKTNNKNGFYSLSIYVDSVLQYHHSMDNFSFSTSRYINSLIDYSEYIETQRRFVRTEVDPNNRLKIYKTLNNDGVFSFQDDEVHQIKIDVADIAGNVNSVSLSVQNIPISSAIVDTNITKKGIEVSWRDENKIELEGMNLNIPPYALYRNEILEIQSSDPLYGCYSKVYHIHRPTIAAHKYMELKIALDSIPEEYEDKLLIAYMNEKGLPYGVGGTYDGTYVKTRIRRFGSYSIMVDTVSPKLIPLNVSDTTFINKHEKLKFTIQDEFSGLKSYRAEMNGKWILMEYDLKNDLLLYKIDSLTREGENNFHLKVYDNSGNLSEFKALLIK
ncbi:M23 family metallopeptidase [Bacteroidota bacterium]